MLGQIRLFYLYLQAIKHKELMKLIDILERRVSDDRFDKNICSWLHTKAGEIIEELSNHLDGVQDVLKEFDIHDAGHSEGVLKVIEDLLGNDAEKLSSYDLFSLIAVAYLHDCGMAVSDSEINVMKMVENEEFDGKKVCTVDEATEIVESNKEKIFKAKINTEEIKNWLFYPGSEQKLFNYYAMLLRDYQAFRNGKRDIIEKSKNLTQTNNDLRIEYIRRTHADRAETYITTWIDTNFLKINTNKQAGKNLTNNIAKACKAHGSDVSYIKELAVRVHYSGKETSNVQFVAMMLRIGDLAHFDYKRAPVVLRALHHFESNYSYEQWRIKSDSGVEFRCESGKIYCQGFCDRPKDYYDLTSYVNYIDQELELYNKLNSVEKWGESYPFIDEKVNRDGLQWDKDLFTPVPNLKFTLEQNKILDLLMGAELYSDDYACLRELYQNSLDACRCQIAKDKSKGRDSEGKIEFGLKTNENGEKYVYCLDNGKGMSKHIIENYLLKIGSSYYKSSEFYQSQAESGNTFTPTSQFGIGILSCFMIGDRVEITTREDGEDFISCVMENIHECFYYKTTPQKDKDVLPSSGTLIKIFLNKEFQERISNEYLENIGYLLWKNEDEYDKDKRNHLDHLYFILDDFVKVVPENITLNVQLSEGNPIKIDSKPQPMGTGIYTYPQNADNKWNIERIDKIVFKELDVEHEGIRYRSYLVLPTEKDPSCSPFNYQYVLYGRNAYCVDGIKVDDSFVEGDFLEVTDSRYLGGVLNFIGAGRPQLSISREKIVKYNPKKYEGKKKELLGKIVKQAIDITVEYIDEKKVKPDSKLYEGIWRFFFERLEDVPVDIVAQQLSGESIRDLVMPFTKAFTSSPMTYGNFFGKDVLFENYKMSYSYERMNYPKLFHHVIHYRISHSDSVLLKGKNVFITGYQPNKDAENYLPLSDGLLRNYDIVSSLYPFLSVSFYEWINREKYKYISFKALWNAVEEIRDNSIGKRGVGKVNRLIKSDLNNTFVYNGKYRILSDKNNDYPDFYSYLAGFFNRNIHMLFSEIISSIRYAGIDSMIITVYIPFSEVQLIRIFESGYNFFREYFSDENKNNYGGFSVVFFIADYRSVDLCFLPGCGTRQELIDKIPDDVWNRQRHVNYHFIDGTKVIRKRN